MTDKTPQDKAENPVNTPTTFAGTTNTAREGEPKSRALPQVDELKARFKAGSIPLQTDFADLIDLANMGRRAVGRAEGQTGPANGFVLSSEGRLELKPNAAKGISVDQDGVAIKLKTISGLTMNEDGIAVKPKANSGIELKDSAGISIKPGDGINVDENGIAVKVEGDKGIQVTNNGISVKPGNGIVFSGNGALDASAGQGIDVNADGINVKAGNGVTVNDSGVTIKAGEGIKVDKDGLAVKVNTAKGLRVTSTGIEIRDGLGLEYDSNGLLGLKVKKDSGFSGGPNGARVIPGNGIALNSKGVNIKLAKGSHTNGGGGQGENGITDGNAGGLALSSAGLSVDAGDGIQINTRGVSIKLATNSGLKVDENNGLRLAILGRGMMMMFSGDVAEVPEGWALCDGNNGTPNLFCRSVIRNESDVVDKADGVHFIMKL